MNRAVSPALVPQRAAQRLPRWALLLLCAAYVLPGLFRRDPWRNADVTAFGTMLGLAEGRSPWLAPTLGGVPVDGAVLPYWVGAGAIRALHGIVDPSVAARLPFGVLLAIVLVLVWYATYHFARTEAAQPLPFAFGGEASVTDYARAIADGSVLATVATLGLLQLGHETTPEMLQLAAVSLLLYSLAGSPFRYWKPRVAVVLALPMLAASGAPTIALGLGAAAIAVSARSGYATVKAFRPWVVGSTLLALGVALGLSAFGWRLQGYPNAHEAGTALRLLLWFLWPAWPLAAWTLWRWRTHWMHRHISVPSGLAAVAVAACIGMGGSDRALMLAIPAVAVLAAFALPAMQRTLAAALDWFSVFFFSLVAAAIWLFYAAMLTGTPSKLAANVAKLVPGFPTSFSPTALIIAGVGSAAWLALVRWRTGRTRHALWKSMVLPASGVALCWLLLMTLWLPLLDYARSYRPLIVRIETHVPAAACIAAPDLPRGLIAALEYFGRYHVDARASSTASGCDYLLRPEKVSAPRPAPAGWRLVAREKRPTDRDEYTVVYRRLATSAAPTPQAP